MLAIIENGSIIPIKGMKFSPGKPKPLLKADDFCDCLSQGHWLFLFY